MELFISIFENSSAKGSFRSNKINYEILQLSADSRYLQSGPLKIFSYLKVTFLTALVALQTVECQHFSDDTNLCANKTEHTVHHHAQ